MDAKTVNKFPIRDYLAAQGIRPAKDNPRYGFYLSPLREERTPSFKVDYGQNLWYDFGLGEVKVSDQKDFVFYGNLTHPSGAIQHMGDNLTGAGDGDDEQIKIDLSKIPANITKIAFTVTIYEAEERRQNFGQVSNAYCRIVDESTNTELIRFDLGEDFSIETHKIFPPRKHPQKSPECQAFGGGKS